MGTYAANGSPPLALAFDGSGTRLIAGSGADPFDARIYSGDGAAPHLDLAEWCLRHNLHRHCADPSLFEGGMGKWQHLTGSSLLCVRRAEKQIHARIAVKKQMSRHEDVDIW